MSPIEMPSTSSRAATLLLSLVVVALATAPARAARPFARDSVWNARLPPTTPVAPSSRRLVAELSRQVASAGAWINTTRYSTPVYTVPASQARVRVALDVAYPALQSAFAAVPLPADAVPARGADAQLTVYEPSTDTLWEFWQLRRAADGWHARWGGRMTDVSANPGYFPAPLGATATGLPLLGGLIRISELRRGRIDHALALAIPAARAQAFVWPAQRGDGSAASPSAIPEGTPIPEGTRFRLDPRVDIASLRLPAVARAIALAAQRYGIVVRDVAGAVTFYAEDPTRLGADPYPALFGARSPTELLARFPWTRLRVVASR
jgi:hypothetical protein